MSTDVAVDASPPAVALMQSLEFWQSFADSVPDMLLLVDHAGTLLYVNRAPAGARKEEVIGRSALDFVPAASRAELRASLVEIFGGAPARLREQQGVHPDGTIHWYATHTGPVIDARVAHVCQAPGNAHRSHEPE